MSLLDREQEKRPSDATRVAEQFEELARRHGYSWQKDQAPAESTTPEASLQESRWLPTTRLKEDG